MYYEKLQASGGGGGASSAKREATIKKPTKQQMFPAAFALQV